MLLYQQFCERYQSVSSDPETRKEYMLWFNDRMREEGEVLPLRLKMYRQKFATPDIYLKPS